ncbi:TRAP transporter small permease [Wukongibacter baidiensis]|uniref:TRAP transporter small permease n=1 Tax=Wukongibacter baidiensis TaxID=1723361 RepID=UPI003D7FA5C3
MLATMDKIIDKMKSILLGILVVIGCAMLGIAWAHVFARYVMNSSLSWSEALLKVMLVWFCLLSTSMISLNREHIGIVIFKEKMPEKVRKVVTLIAQMLLVVASLAVIYVGIRMVINAGSRSIPALPIPYALAYAAVPTSFTIITFYEIRNTVYDIVHYNSQPL